MAIGEETSCVQSTAFPSVSPVCKDALIQLMVAQDYFGRGEKILKAAEAGVCKLYGLN